MPEEGTGTYGQVHIPAGPLAHHTQHSLKLLQLTH